MRDENPAVMPAANKSDACAWPVKSEQTASAITTAAITFCHIPKLLDKRVSRSRSRQCLNCTPVIHRMGSPRKLKDHDTLIYIGALVRGMLRAVATGNLIRHAAKLRRHLDDDRGVALVLQLLPLFFSEY